MIIVFYISGHGFGHASRQTEVVHALLARRPHARIVLRTQVPAWFFESAHLTVEHEEAEIDTGIVQIDSLRFDEEETARRAAEFYRDFDRKVTTEAAHLRRLG